MLALDSSGLSVFAHALLNAPSEDTATHTLSVLTHALSERALTAVENTHATHTAKQASETQGTNATQAQTSTGDTAAHVDSTETNQHMSKAGAGAGASTSTRVTGEHVGAHSRRPTAPTALHIACTRGWQEPTRVLLALPSDARRVTGDVSSRDARGDTPLHAAARGAAQAGAGGVGSGGVSGQQGSTACLAVMRYLIEEGADDVVTNDAGRTAADLLGGSLK